MIIAIKEKDKVVIGYSNAEAWGRLCEKDYVDEENVAIRFTEDGKLFACADMNRRSDILLYDDEFLSKEITPKSIIREIIPYIKKKLKEFLQMVQNKLLLEQLLTKNSYQNYQKIKLLLR